MARGKWISGLRADMPLADAARRVLKTRLTAARKNVLLALRESEKDPEHVHQLRVSTRRAAAALRIFESCLGQDFFWRTHKTLRRLRRAAGKARDWDVFQLDLQAHLAKAPPARQQGLQFLLGHAAVERHAAQAKLLKQGKRQVKALATLVAELPAAVKRERKGRLADLAQPLITHLVAKLNDAAKQDLSPYEKLHKVRIAGKRLRYALEVFADCFGSALEDAHYPAVERLQEILGQANDSRSAVRRLEEMRADLRKQPEVWRPCRPGIEALLRYHRRRAPQLRRAFLQWWRDWRQNGSKALVSALKCS